MSVHVIGDSHAAYLFARAATVTTHSVPGHTMHRVGRDGATDLLHGAPLTREDTLIFVFGEIDVRCHLLRVATSKGWGLERATQDLAQRYVAALAAARESSPERPKICLLEVVPPIDPLTPNPLLPVVGTLAERLAIWYLLNEALKTEARRSGFTFIRIPKIYRKRDASLKRRYSDCHAHIAKDCTEPLVRAVERELGLSLGFRPLPRRSHWLRMMTRFIAVANKDYSTLWTLGFGLDQHQNRRDESQRLTCCGQTGLMSGFGRGFQASSQRVAAARGVLPHP